MLDVALFVAMSLVEAVSLGSIWYRGERQVGQVFHRRAVRVRVCACESSCRKTPDVARVKFRFLPHASVLCTCMKIIVRAP
jgi:hypothetical protein